MPENTSNNNPGNDLNSTPPVGDDKAAADLIRAKVARIYNEEPDAKEEISEADSTPRRSKHQQFMFDLSSSGKDLATIQTEWHNYYQSLPAKGKHEVWQEFYDSQSLLTSQPQRAEKPTTDEAQQLSKHKHQASKTTGRNITSTKRKLTDVRSTADIKATVKNTVSSNGKLQAKHHVQSLIFGLAMGLIVIIIFLFGFFNELVIAPFIQPGRTATNTPLIIGTGSIAPTANPEVIIPKINVEIPVDYSVTTTDENVIENDLQNGVVHYPTTSLPGQTGNTAFFGHSSNNIFNKGKYKFAFVLLHTLVPGDTFYLTYQGKVYVYKVISRQIVDPSDVSVLNPVPGQTATATLITCDPPGTSLHRLVVVGQQISPDPAGNSASTSTQTNQVATTLPGNGQTLWGHFIQSGTGKTVAIVVVLGAGFVVLRRFYKKI